MATFELEIDGKTFEVDAPSIDAAMSAIGAGPQKKPQAEPPASRLGQFARPQIAEADTLTDVGKSAGAGLVRGAAGLAMLPGNLETLGRAGINYAGSKITGKSDPIVSPRSVLPNSNDALQVIEHYSGQPLYRPSTRAGQYAGAVGEFAPNMLLPGPAGLASKAATNVVGPAVLSETAGQATEGSDWETPARIAGAVVGSMAPSMATRLVSPMPTNPARAQHVQTLQNEGVTDLTAGQKTGRMPLRWAESAANDVPGSGTRAAQLMEQQGEQFTAAVLKRAGINANRADKTVIDQAFSDIGSKFDAMAQASTLRFSQPVLRDVRMAEHQYNRVVPEAMRSPIVKELAEEIDQLAKSGAVLAGDRYQGWRSTIESAARGASDPYLQTALRDIKTALDDAVEKALPAKIRGDWQEARRQYRNMLVIEKAATAAGAETAQGIISPAALRTATAVQNRRAYARGKGDLADLARSGAAVMDKLPQSGTTPRAIASNVGKVVLGGAAGGATYGGQEGAAGGALAPFVLQALFSRGLMSRPVQNYLANQTAVPVRNALTPPPRTPIAIPYGARAYQEEP